MCETIQFSKKLVDVVVTNGLVELHFDNGETATGDMIIGCDGSHSRVREFLVGRELAQNVFTGTTMVNYSGGTYSADQAKLLRSFHPIVQLCPHHNISSITLLAGIHSFLISRTLQPDTADDLVALDIPDQQDPTAWKFQKLCQWYVVMIAEFVPCLLMLVSIGRWGPPYAQDLQDPKVRMESLKKRLSHFPDPFRTAWLALKDDEVLPVYPGQQ